MPSQPLGVVLSGVRSALALLIQCRNSLTICDLFKNRCGAEHFSFGDNESSELASTNSGCG